MEYRFRVYGEPKAQPRPTFASLFPDMATCHALWRASGSSLVGFIKKLKKSTRGTAFVPKDSPVHKWKLDVMTAFYRLRKHNHENVMYRIDLVFLMPRPQKLHKRFSGWGTSRVPMAIKKFDFDNLGKAFVDAGTDTKFWEDDGLIVDGRIRKFYAAVGERPGCEAIIEVIPTVRQKKLFDTDDDDDF